MKFLKTLCMVGIRFSYFKILRRYDFVNVAVKNNFDNEYNDEKLDFFLFSKFQTN